MYKLSVRCFENIYITQFDKGTFFLDLKTFFGALKIHVN